jgi:type I restriction enzyme M protein
METNILKIIEESQDLIRNIDGLTGSDAFEEVIKVFFTLNSIKTEGHSNISASEIKLIFETQLSQEHDFFSGSQINLKDLTVNELIRLFSTVELSSEDVKGRLFEGFLGRVFTSGLGQFFTPRELVDFMTDFCKKNNLINDNEYVLDPACGSAGILMKCQLSNQRLIGFDINERLVRVSKMNMILNGVSNFEIYNQSFLDDIDLPPISLVVTNPPFGVDEKQKEILEKFKFGVGRKKRELEILFVEKIINILKPGGVCAIVLPDGFFNNISLQKEREYLLNHCDLIASVDLPENVFKSTGTGCETGILVFQKKIKPSNETKPFKVYRANFVGFETQTKFAKKIEENDLIKILNDSTYTQSVVVTDLNSTKRFDGKFYLRKKITDNNPKLQIFKKSGKNINKVYKDSDIIKYIQYSDIDPVFGLIKSHVYFAKSDAPSRAKIVVSTGDILIPKLKQSSDKIALVTEEYNGAVVTNGFFVVKSLDPNNTEYLFAILKKSQIQNQLKDFSSGTIMPSIDDDLFNEITYVKESEDESEKISESIKEVFHLIKSAKDLLENLK